MVRQNMPEIASLVVRTPNLVLTNYLKWQKCGAEVSVPDLLGFVEETYLLCRS